VSTVDQPLDPYQARPVDQDALQVLDPYTAKKVARHTSLAVTWESRAIARDISPDLIALTYVDNLTGAADDLQFEVQDRDSLWSGDWQPETGDVVVARARAAGWFGFGQPVTELRLGKFAHDKITLTGPPHTVTLAAVSAPIATALRRRKRTRAWRGVTIKQIAQDIADRAQMTLGFDGAEGPKYKHAVQNDKSDLEFLEEECKQIGRSVKVTESTIQIFQEETLDGRPAAGEIDLIGGYVLDPNGWSFDGDDSARYGSCHVSCFNPTSGKVLKFQFPPNGTTIPGLDPNGQTLELVMSVSDVNHAVDRAKGMLRRANQFGSTGKLNVVGDLGLVAGVPFDLKNAGKFDGKYMITRAEHHLLGGYTTALTVRRCLEGY
jgi:phage protein D